MIIHSKFHDYYDSAAGFGIDKNLHYVRNTKIIENPDRFAWICNKEQNGSNYIYPFIIFFCGKMYPGIILYTSTLGKKIIYEYEHIPDVFHKHYVYMNNLKKHFETSIYRMSPLNQHYQCPIIVQRHEKLSSSNNIIVKLNACLSDYNFQCVIEPYQAFQEIAMYLVGVLSKSGPEVINITDKSKVIKHGFDKWSFRKFKRKNIND